MTVGNETQRRYELLAKLGDAGRDMSTATILFHSAVAERFGLNPTDWKCGDLVSRKGPLTAGQLAEMTGLTTGAITGVVDRLEKAGFVRREHDPEDRRRVIIRTIEEKEEEANAFMQGIFSDAVFSLDAYSDRDLALILEFMTRNIDTMHEIAKRVRSETKERSSRKQQSSPASEKKRGKRGENEK